MNEWTLKCDLCKKVKPDNENWSWWDGWLSFIFCPDCEKNHDSECVKVMAEAESERIRRGREYWATHPEELAQHKRETEEYRRTCLDVDGLPWNFKRPLWNKIWNWALRTCGYKKKYKY